MIRSPCDRRTVGIARSCLRALPGDERGFTLVFFAVAFPVLVGLVGLAIDVGRLFEADSELAAVSDAAALAAASRLDRGENAIAQARRAVSALRNETRLAGTSVDFTLRFARTRTELRDSPTFTLSDAESPDAALVEVTTTPQSISAGFLAFVGATPKLIQRRSWAMSRYLACGVTPLLMCHRDPERFIARAQKGRQYRLRHSTDRTDGTLVAIDQPGDDRGAATPFALASPAPAFCYTDPIKVRPNVAVRQFDDAMNLRFDRYANRLGPIAPELAVFPPAPSVIKGQRYGTCFSPSNSGDFNPPYPLPRDSAFRNLNAAFAFDAGAGDWKTTRAYGGSGSSARTALEEYVFWNHAEKTPLFRGSLLSSATRYELYLKELGLDEQRDASRVPTFVGALDNTLPTGGPKVGPYRLASEIATPRCYRGPSPADDARRRILYVAVADCGNLESTATAPRLSRAVAKFFMTEPTRDGFVLVEFERFLTPRFDDGKLRRLVELVDVN